MITPRSPSSFGVFLSISATARRITLKVPLRLTRTTASNISSGIGPCLPTIFFTGPTAAQFTTMCSAPKAATVCCIACAT